MEKLAPAPSLRAIAELINDVLGQNEALGKAASSTPVTPVEVPRFTFTAVDCPRRGAVKHYPGRVCLITDDETGIAAGIVDAWTRAGEKVLLLRQCSDAPLTAAGVYSGDLKDPAVVNELVQAVRSQHGPIGALVHLLPLRSETAVPPNSLAEWRNHLQLDLKSMYALIRACETDLRKTGESGGALIAVATGRGGGFTGNGEASSAALPTHRALADFCRTVALEIPEARCRIIDLDITDPAMILREKLLEELGSSDSILEVGLPGDRRLTPAIQNAPLKAARRREIAPDWVCMLTGGARGITAEVARLLAERQHPTLVIVGTTPLPAEEESAQTAGIADPQRLKSILMERLRGSGAAVRPADVEALMQRLLKEREIRATLASLRQAGSSVEYHAVDVRDETLFGGLIDDIYRRYGRLDVVVHGAGIIEDKLIRDKVPESFDRVVGTKADSSCILAQKLRPESLQCLMLMSSVTAAFGNRGQADYGAANGVMNGFAMRLAKMWPGSVVAVNWGPWDQANMVSEHVRRQFVSSGVQIIPLTAGAEAAVREIESGGEHESVVVLGGGPWQEKTLPAQSLQRVSTAGKL
jgi:NAD(P)-dependent dehydrogenase (short-subunit alcohol dehydrogenase family)